MTGQITQAMSFGAWGERREAINWNLPFMGMLASLRNITPRGFTGHEMIDHAGIIHMNGRIYDSRLGRFLQADPNVQAPDNSQNLNRYSYVLNNPLSYTDPSGFFFKAIGKFVGKYWRQLVAVGIGIATAGIASGLSFWAGLAVSVAGGALAGYVSTGTLNGALIGAFSGAAFYGVGQYFESLRHANGLEAANAADTAGTGNVQQAFAYAANASLNSVQRIGQVVAHGMAGGVIGKLQGGRFAHGFASAGITKAFSRTIASINVGSRLGNMYLQTTAAAVLGGGISEATGGKFGNGARTAGFGYLFNQVISNGGLFKTRSEAEEHANELKNSGGKNRYTVVKTEDGEFTLQLSGLRSIEVGVSLDHAESVAQASSPRVCSIFCGTASAMGSIISGDHSQGANSDALNISQDVNESSSRLLDELIKNSNSDISEFAKGLSRVSGPLRMSLLIPAINNNYKACYSNCTSNFQDR